MSNQIQIAGSQDAYVVVKCTLKNTSGAEFTLHAEKSCQVKSKSSSAAPEKIGDSHEFTMSPHDEIVYKSSLGDEADIKIKFDDDDDCPKLKLGDFYEKDDCGVCVETTTVEREEETETKFEEQTTTTRSAGEKLPEFKETKETEEEQETGNVKTEIKTKSKTEISKRKKKVTVTKKTESKKKQVEITWVLQKL